MTETEWLACTDPLKMLDCRPRKTDTRRLRLLACAFARHVWHLLGDPRSRNAVKVAEDYAEGEAFIEQLQVAWQEAREAAWAYPSKAAWLPVRAALRSQLQETARGTVQEAVEVQSQEAGRRDSLQLLQHPGAVMPPAAQVAILRDIVGNPFRPCRVTGPGNPNGCLDTDEYPIIDTGIRPWQPGRAAYTPIMDGRIYQASLEMYEARDFCGLPIVADMLEETGAANALVLQHLRSPGPHYRGCWAVDLILGRWACASS